MTLTNVQRLANIKAALKASEADDENRIEYAYWLFDDYKKKTESERDAFKAAVREAFAAQQVPGQ